MRDRKDLAKKRILSVLQKHGIATARTLEQKISDAGPYNQRINPHVLTPARNLLIDEGEVIKIMAHPPGFTLKILLKIS